MEQYSRLATPRFRRITIRLSSIEIELRARPRPVQERATPEERAWQRARAEAAMSSQRYNTVVRCLPWI